MFKAYHLRALIAISLSAAFTTTLGAWGQRQPLTQTEEPVDIRFPLSPTQGWGLEESLLVWKTFEDNTDYAVRLFSNGETKESIKHPSFDWSTGVRLKLTRYLPSNDPWDVNLIGTYYYDQADSDTHVNFLLNDSGSENTLSSPWETPLFGQNSKAKASTQMNFFTFDLTVGRYYSLTHKIDIHPFVGIRSTLNYQKYNVRYVGVTEASPAGPFVHTKFKGDYDFWGLGPRVGTDVALRIGRHWNLMGTFGASLFAGRYDVSEAFNGNIARLGENSVIHEKLTDEDTVLRSNLDASLGLEWEKWVRNKTVRIAPSFVFEVSEWFSMKRWVDSHIFRNSFSGNDQPINYPHRRYSDLGLMGFNINLKVDF